MKKIYFKNLNEYFNKKITVEGFVDNIRDLQYVQFIILLYIIIYIIIIT